MKEYSFKLTDEEMIKCFEDGSAFRSGLRMEREEGITVAWMTDPEKAAAILPPPLELLAPIITCNVVNIDGTNFARVYQETYLAIPVTYNGVPGIYMPSLFLHGPGAYMGAIAGRDATGTPKKLADEISLLRRGDTAHAYVVKDDVHVIDIELEFGEYNLPEAKEMFKANEENGTVDGACYFIKTDLNVNDQGGMEFRNTRLTTSTGSNQYFEWTPASAKVTLNPCENAPWSELEVVKVIGGGWSRFAIANGACTELCKMNDKDVIPYLIKGLYDVDIINKPNRKYQMD
ncbi:MAG: acetoacetate decarboxylase family protein [Eubacteriales bacterium]|nr:acetoacetate decarboxylase family protein [Eubacteriales bacterium]